jgi:DNA ligase 1
LKTHAFPMLYKESSIGKIQRWVISVEEQPDGTANYVTRYGQVDGKQQETTVKVTTGKNIGKANETTPYQQAFSEAGAKWLKQKDKGYSESLRDASLFDPIIRRPMLAHDYQKYGHKVKYPCFVQPKLDGVRCIAYGDYGKDGNFHVILLSRQGKQFDIPHLKATLASILEKNPELVLDGELYAHGHTFQEIISWVKRTQSDTEKIKYHVYDNIAPFSFAKRIEDVHEFIEGVPHLVAVPTRVINKEEEIVEKHDEFKAKGFEGIMVRHGDCHYKEGYRSQELLKMKTFCDSEFKIIGAKEGVGKCEGQCIFTCETALGTPFDVKIMGTDAYRQKLWAHRDDYIGQMLTVKYFEMTDGEASVPRFPVGVGIRDFE